MPVLDPRDLHGEATRPDTSSDAFGTTYCPAASDGSIGARSRFANRTSVSASPPND